jgi:hypothetical protein
MPKYLCKTPLKVMLDLESKETKVFTEGEIVDLSETDAAELLTLGAIDGPLAVAVDAGKKK